MNKVLYQFCEMLVDIAKSEKPLYKKDLSFNQNVAIMFLIQDAPFTQTTKDIMTEQYINNTARADILAKVIIAEIKGFMSKRG